MVTAVEKNIAGKRIKKRKRPISRLIAWLHLWPGIISGVIVVFVCFTGTALVFFDEILNAVNKTALHVQPSNVSKLPLEKLMGFVKQAYPDRVVSYVIVYKDPTRSVKALTFSRTEESAPLTMHYLDPYTGKIIKSDNTYHWFYILAHLHNSLLLEDVGVWIVDIATIIFLLELITGLVLWWPKKWTRATRKQSFTINGKARLKRLNYDLHNVLGFYSLILAVLLAVTGLIMAFAPLKNTIAKTFGGSDGEAFEARLDQMSGQHAVYPMSTIASRYFSDGSNTLEVQFFTYNLDSAGFYAVTTASQINLLSYNNGRVRYINKATGQEITVSQADHIHEQVDNINMQLHMGTWLSPYGKLLTFVAGLITTSLPITGFYIWWGRRKKKGTTSTTARPEAGRK